jgi:glycerol-3-phosphate dehydrogenase
MTRPEMLNQLLSHTAEWDIIIVGGGATGVGVAIDAASRGYDTLLLEGSDFGKGTSRRSTKLVHGGVRYLKQENVPPLEPLVVLFAAYIVLSPSYASIVP